MEFIAEEVNYYKNHLDELGAFIDYSFEEYYKDFDMPTLILALKVAAQAKGININIEANTFTAIHAAFFIS